MSTASVLAEIAAERARQTERWGEQNPPLVPEGTPACFRPRLYGIPTEAQAKVTCEARFLFGEGTYFDVLIEEVCEAIEAPTPAAMRAELVQCGAVIAAMIEAHDRRHAP